MKIALGRNQVGACDSQQNRQDLPPAHGLFVPDGHDNGHHHNIQTLKDRGSGGIGVFDGGQEGIWAQEQARQSKGQQPPHISAHAPYPEHLRPLP